MHFDGALLFRRAGPEARLLAEVDKREGIPLRAEIHAGLRSRLAQRGKDRVLPDAPEPVARVAIAAVSGWLIESAIRTLGKQWAMRARLVEGHQLITVGPYAIISGR